MWDYWVRNGQKSVYRVTREWSDQTATWRIPWTHQGGDFDSLNPISNSSHNDTTVKVWERFDVTGVVRDFIRNPSGNFGFLIRFEDADRRGIMVHSSKSRVADKRPKLVISTSTGVQHRADNHRCGITVVSTAGGIRLSIPTGSGYESIAVYSVAGKRIGGIENVSGGNTYMIPLNRAQGVYIVRLSGPEGSMSQIRTTVH